MGGTMEKQTLEKDFDQPEIYQNGKTGKKNNKNKKEIIENQSTKSLVKPNEGKSHHKRNGVSKKKKMIRYLFLPKIRILILKKKHSN